MGTLQSARFGLGLATCFACGGGAAAQSASTFNFHSITDPSSWKVGAFAGQFNNRSEQILLYMPWRATNTYAAEYIAAADAVYTFINIPRVPLNAELDFSASAHFGEQEFAEFTVTPVLRWTWFPWNNWIYTNLRYGALGPSVTTELSNLEARGTVNKQTSYFLAGGVEELTFAPSKESPWEAFFRIHHRSGVFGLINGVDGGSNYVTFGWRSQL